MTIDILDHACKGRVPEGGWEPISEGFGVHSFRLVNAQGTSRLVKFHWKPIKGVHGLAWDEAQKLAGKDPDFHRRDLADAIAAGDFPQWELGVQVVEEAGVAVLSSCTEGTCGTCETTVLSGEVDHRDSLLTPAEQAANDTMFICVSRAACPKLVLEL